MLRFKILASAVPLIVAAVLARGEFSINSRPCIAIGGASVQITASPWQAQLQVSFTSDPSSAGAADFAVVDDVDSAEDGPADYRIFVHSKRFTASDAAALIVGAGGVPSRLAAASL